MLLATRQDRSSSSHRNVQVIEFQKSGFSTNISSRNVESGNTTRIGENSREKLQHWNDGSVYNGSFREGKREGHGEAKWQNGETYIGEFLRDKREGKGTYIWPDGSQYEGYFKKNKRAGYGKFVYANGNTFEGIYADDIRDGPGVLTYLEEGRQDIGIWFNERIVKICQKLNNAFTFDNFLQHSINGGEKQVQMKIDKKSKKKKKNITQDSFCNLEIDEEILSTLPESFQYMDIIMCSRDKFMPKGPLEILSEELIAASSERDVVTVERILREKDVHPDVTDRTGFGAILAAAVNCHVDVLNCLLDFGGNINGLNDEGLSALAACHILLYTEQDFINNIAENIQKENSFNSIEWDKQRGCFVHRNDRKTILSMYGALRSSDGESSRKNRRKSSQESLPASLLNEKVKAEETLQTAIEEEDSDQSETENWKLIYYQRTLSRSEELHEINRSFQKLKARPFDFDDVMEESAPPPLRTLTAEEVAREIENNKDDDDNGPSNLTEASIYCGDSNFGGAPKIEITNDDTRQRLLNAERKPHLNATIKLLLERGADPNASCLPMPVLFFAVKAANTESVDALLSKGADPSIRLGSKGLGLTPLHIAVALPCPEGIEITRLLLEAGADPDITDLLFGDTSDGRTALHIACAREDCDKDAQKVIECLLRHQANPNALCQGYSPLALAIASGNDPAVDTLLKYGADPSTKLTNGVGSALCASTTFAAERRRKPNDRLKLIDKLVKAGADLLAPIFIMDKFPPGTVVDYAYHVFNQDRRIAHTPYHALSALERACHNTRKEVLEHLGNLLRTAALKREKEMMEAELSHIAETGDSGPNQASDKPSVDFDVASSKTRSANVTSKDKRRALTREKSPRRDPNCGLPFAVVKSNDPKTIATLEMNAANQRRLEAKRRFRYCYECGRLIGIRLAACTRCKEVFYCSKNCKVKAWNLRHKDECARLSGRSTNATEGNRVDSPTPTTEADSEIPLLELRNKLMENVLDSQSIKSNHTTEKKLNKNLLTNRQTSASSKTSKAGSHKAASLSLRGKDSRRESKLSSISKQSGSRKIPT